MRALYYPAFDELVVTDRPDPEPAAGEVILRVAACGICGSELEAFESRNPRRTPPLVMGHEFCGEVEATGGGVSQYVRGQRVVSHSLVPCGTCVRCRRGDTHLCARRQIFGMNRAGAFAEYVAVPARCLVPWPEAVPAEAACLAEPLANGIHMVHLTRAWDPDLVLVIGAGPIGLAAQQAFQALTGARVVVGDLSRERVKVAARLGATKTFDPREIAPEELARELTNGEGADVVIDAVGLGLTKRQSLEAARPGGAVVWIGLREDAMELSSYGVTLPERHVMGTYAATQDELSEAVRLMESGAVDMTSWPEAFPLEQGAEAFRRMLAAKGSDLKAVLVP